ncbi:MAG: hypothetical protein ACYDCN_10400 [Bacteroidia bacterium]
MKKVSYLIPLLMVGIISCGGPSKEEIEAKAKATIDSIEKVTHMALAKQDSIAAAAQNQDTTKK